MAIFPSTPQIKKLPNQRCCNFHRRSEVYEPKRKQVLCSCSVPIPSYSVWATATQHSITWG